MFEPSLFEVKYILFIILIKMLAAIVTRSDAFVVTPLQLECVRHWTITLGLLLLNTVLH